MLKEKTQNRFILKIAGGIKPPAILLFIITVPSIIFADAGEKSQAVFSVFESSNLPVFVEINRVSEPPADVPSPADPVVKTAFTIYKKTVSPYWGWQCNFEPSCSEFCVKSITTHGFLLGTLMTADRLSRDHNLIRRGWYEEIKNGRFFDPVPEKDQVTLNGDLNDSSAKNQ